MLWWKTCQNFIFWQMLACQQSAASWEELQKSLMLPSVALSCPTLLRTSLWNKWYKIALLLNFWEISNAPAVALYVVAVCSLSVELIFDPVWHTCSTTLSHTPYVSLMIIQNKAPCGASLWRCSGFSCQGCKRNYRRRNTHTHTLKHTDWKPFSHCMSVWFM